MKRRAPRAAGKTWLIAIAVVGTAAVGAATAVLWLLWTAPFAVVNAFGR